MDYRALSRASDLRGTVWGGASVLLRKERAFSEVYNDLDDEVYNLFEVLRDPERANRLQGLVTLTPFSRTEYARSRERATDSVERARRLLVRANMGFGTDSPRMNARTGFRSTSNRSGTTPAQDWAHWPLAVPFFARRLAGITLENRDAKACMEHHDSEDALHYVDPPYVHSTRSKVTGRYRYEMTDEEHCELAAFLDQLKGYVVLSGYPSELYDRLYAHWHRVERVALADGAAKRTEVLWLSPRTWAALHPRLF